MTVIKEPVILMTKEEANSMLEMIKLVENHYDLDPEDVALKKRLRKFIRSR